MAHIKQSRPDSGLGFQVKVRKPFEVVRLEAPPPRAPSQPCRSPRAGIHQEGRGGGGGRERALEVRAKSVRTAACDDAPSGVALYTGLGLSVNKPPFPLQGWWGVAASGRDI